jgi:hypothetical protein
VSGLLRFASRDEYAWSRRRIWQSDLDRGKRFLLQPNLCNGIDSGTITLRVHNGGVVLHNVSIPQLHIDQDMSPGQTITVVVQMGNTPLVFFCKYHRGSGMLGALIPAGS